LLALLGQLHLEGLPSAKVKSPLATIWAFRFQRWAPERL
jgi:hypothetical protein